MRMGGVILGRVLEVGWVGELGWRPGGVVMGGGGHTALLLSPPPVPPPREAL